MKLFKCNKNLNANKTGKEQNNNEMSGIEIKFSRQEV